VKAEGLLRRMQAGFGPDAAMVDALAALRAAGVPVALVTNAFGRDCYRGFDLDALADVVVISSDIGVRKPSRRIYAIACERLGVAPESAVMIDDIEHNLAGAAKLGIAGVLHRSAPETLRELDERFGIRPAQAPAR
jgi:putative hydrolase of the HAD superfamily